jgi:glycerol uptake facilitator-like aquaporin
MTTCEMIKFAAAKLCYEMIGTFIITLTYVNPGTNSAVLIFFVMWICNSFCLRVSGAHFNPAISFAFSLRKDTGGLPRKLAVAYILAQIAGATAACLLGLWIFDGIPAAQPKGDNANYIFPAMMAELLGTFCYTFFFLSQTEEKTVISQIETIHCFVLAAAFIAARTIVAGNGDKWCA